MRSTLETKFVLAALAVALVATAQVGHAQDPAQELPPGMTPEMMQQWAEAATPGPEHEKLAAMVGSWTFTGTFMMAPGVPPTTTTGTAERTLMFGRVLVEKVRSEMMGQVFEGQAMTGFDNVSGEYWGTWNDNMGTGLMISTGTCSEDGSCEFTGTYNDPWAGGPKTVRMTVASTDEGEVHAMYDKTPDGEEFKSMELVYTRVSE